MCFFVSGASRARRCACVRAQFDITLSPSDTILVIVSKAWWRGCVQWPLCRLSRSERLRICVCAREAGACVARLFDSNVHCYALTIRTNARTVYCGDVCLLAGHAALQAVGNPISSRRLRAPTVSDSAYARPCTLTSISTGTTADTITQGVRFLVTFAISLTHSITYHRASR